MTHQLFDGEHLLATFEYEEDANTAMMLWTKAFGNEHMSVRPASQFIVAFMHDEDIDFVRWAVGPYHTQKDAEIARVEFIETVDEVDEWSAVHSGDVLELLPYSDVVSRVTKSLKEQQEK